MVRVHPGPHKFVILQFMQPQSKSEKIKHLLRELEKYQSKLTELYKHYRGVIHESAASEIRHTTVKVYESHVQSIKEELRSLGYEGDLD